MKESCDVVLSVDSAYHYDTRQDFFIEARRVLKVGVGLTPGWVSVCFDVCAWFLVNHRRSYYGTRQDFFMEARRVLEEGY